MAWRFEGTEREGIVTNDQDSYPYELEDGEIRISFPFAIDQDALKRQLTAEGWAVARDHDRTESLGWGPRHDVEGYYPYWVRANPVSGATILAFPPRDYRVSSDFSHGSRHIPVFGSEALREFERWLLCVQKAENTALRL